MRPLAPLAALFLICAPSARAQTKNGAVDVSLTPGMPGPSAPLTPNAVPQLVTLNLAAPSLALTPGVVAAPEVNAKAAAPLALAPAAPLAAAAPVPALPATAVSPAAVVGRPVALDKAGAPESLESGDERTSIAEQLEKTRALFGESGRRARAAELAAVPEPGSLAGVDATKKLFAPTDTPGVMSSKYLRLDEPFKFGSAEVFRYRIALDAYGAKDGGEATETLLNAAEALAASAGIKTERGVRTLPDGTPRPVLKILPQMKGHRLNRLAWDLARGYGAGVEYSPERTRGGTAAFNGVENVLFLPDFGNEKAFEAVLHESRHAAFAKRLRNGDVSVFHGSLIAYAGRDIAPGAESYDKYMSLEELSTHVKTLLHTIIRAQRGDGDEAVWKATSYAFQLIDVLRSAEINLFQLQRKLEKGEVASSRVEGSPTFHDFKGGHWEVINLPHAMFVLPVLDEAPAPKRNLLDRVFKAKPETAGVKAARKHVEALRPMIASVGEELETFLGALRGENKDLAKARASASRMTSLAAKAEEKFAASK